MERGIAFLFSSSFIGEEGGGIPEKTKRVISGRYQLSHSFFFVSIDSVEGLTNKLLVFFLCCCRRSHRSCSRVRAVWDLNDICSFLLWNTSSRASRLPRIFLQILTRI